MAGYSRQSAASIVPTAVVRATPLNNEFNTLRDAFAFSGGHRHDGSATEGAYIPLIADVAGLNKVAVDSANNRLGVFVNVSGVSTEQFRVVNGAIVPVTDNVLDLGSASFEFKDLYIDGVANIDSLVADTVNILAGTINGTSIGATVPSTGAFTTASASGGFTGNLTGNVTGNVSGTAANVTGIVAIANGGTGLSALGTGVQTALGQAVTGTGGFVLATSPTLVTPNLGTPSAVTLTNATGLPISTGVTGMAAGAATFLVTPSSANLASLVTDETGTGALVFAGSPTFTGTVSGAALTLSGALTLNGGTANGIAYLNGSKVLTSGSALTFDGTKLGVNIASPTLNFEVGGNTATGYMHSGVSVFSIGSKNNYPVSFDVNNTEAMRLTSTGLGIGTSSPGAKLEILTTVASSTPAAIFRAPNGVGNTGGLAFYHNDTNANARNWYLVPNSNAYGDFVIKVGTSQGANPTTGINVATFDSSGNLGLGVTPSAWGFGGNLELPATNNISFQGAYGNINSNAYYDLSQSRWEYITSGYAAQYQIGSAGQHIWYTAPSWNGTGSNAISFTQAMTLTQGGNLLVGTTVDGSRLTIGDPGTGASFINAASGNFNLGLLAGTGSADAYVYQRANNPLIFGTNNTERARITSGGDLLVGASATSANFDGRVNVAGRLHTKANSGTTALHFIWNEATSGDNGFVNFGTEGTFTSRGSITYNRAGGLVGFNTTSDYRSKDIIGPVQNTGATIDALKIYEGVMKGATQSRPMMIAHEAQAVVPFCVSGEKDAVNTDGTPKYQQMDHASLVPLLIAELQSLRARVAALETK